MRRRPEWRNRQTRGSQTPLRATSSGFKSRLRHQYRRMGVAATLAAIVCPVASIAIRGLCAGSPYPRPTPGSVTLPRSRLGRPEERQRPEVVRDRCPYGPLADAAMRAYNAGEVERRMRSWTLAFLIRHSAFHMLDHAWEMEDKDLSAEGGA
jgi:hypothetical protein